MEILMRLIRKQRVKMMQKYLFEGTMNPVIGQAQKLLEKKEAKAIQKGKSRIPRNPAI